MKAKINSALILEIRPENEDEARILELWWDTYQDEKVADMSLLHFEVKDDKSER